MAKLKDIRFRRADLSNKDIIDFSKDMLGVLMAISEDKNLLQVAQETGLSIEKFKENLKKLFQLKLVEEVKEKIICIPETQLLEIREILLQLLGPMAEALMLDAAEKMELTPGAIPSLRFAEYVRIIAVDIPGVKQKNEFQNIMFEKLSNQ